MAAAETLAMARVIDDHLMGMNENVGSRVNGVQHIVKGIADKISSVVKGE